MCDKGFGSGSRKLNEPGFAKLPLHTVKSYFFVNTALVGVWVTYIPISDPKGTSSESTALQLPIESST